RAAAGHGRAPVAVDRLHALHGRAGEVGLRQVAALLEDDDAEPGARELVRHHGTARARAHHAHVGDLLDVAAHVRVLERYQTRARAWRAPVQAPVPVAERRLDARVGAEGGETERLQEEERDAPPREAARKAALDPRVPRRRRETAEAAKVARGERRGLPGAQQETHLALRLRRLALKVARQALRRADVPRTDRQGAPGRNERLGERAEHAQLGVGQHRRIILRWQLTLRNAGG